VSRVKFIDPAIKSLFLLALPILLSNTTLEINQFINRLLASNLGGGTVSAFSYSGTLSLFVTGTLSLSVVTIYYTEFSHASSVSVNKEQMTKLLSQSTLVIFALVLPVTVLTCFLAGDIVTIAYGRGAFSAQAVSLTARCLFFYSIGFVFIVLKALYNKAFLAMRNSRVPMLVSFCEVCINIAVATLMAPRLGIAGIVIAIPFSAMISVIIMLIILKTKLLFSLRQLFLPSVVKLTLMTLLASLATLFCMYLLSNQDAIVRFCMTCVAVFVFYIGCLYHLRFEGTQVLFAILERFFLKTRFTNK
jgi:putative peptidoglycan lipid II flippase